MTFSDDRTARFVDAARDLANASGSAAFTVAQLAAHAQLSLKAFYRCFPSKDDLLIALLAEESRVGAALFEQLVAGTQDQLGAFVHELFAMATLPEYAGYAGVLAHEHRRLMEHRPEATVAALAPLTDFVAARIATSDPRRDAQTVFRLLMDGFHDVVLGRVDDVAEFADYLLGFCRYGLGDATRRQPS
jgi:AcrR family transcriptional regulator